MPAHKKTLLNQWLGTKAILGVLLVLLVFPPIATAKNLPKTIEHEHSHSPQTNHPEARLEAQKRQADRKTEEARQNLQRARQDHKRFAPGQDTPYGNQSFERLRAESELIRSQQELRNAEGNQYSLDRRIESAERDAQLRRDRNNTRSPRADFQRSYPKIEYGRRR
tara:strand:+ start:81475 stop:81972 length:498 start_codon:yes stop_codon:yes gene_type:complete